MEAVRDREEQLSDAWIKREAEIKKELEESFKSVDERIQWVVVNKENDLVVEETRLNELREELEEGMSAYFLILKLFFTDPTQSEKRRTLWRRLKTA